MCNPAAVVATTAVISAGSAMYSSIQQGRAAEQQADAQADAAKAAQNAEHQALSEQAQQIADKGADERLARQREALRERARLRVEGGGLTSTTLENLQTKSKLNENFDIGTIDKNVQNGLMQNAREFGRTNAQTYGRIRNANASRTSKTARGIGTALSGINAGLQGYSLGQSLFAPKGNS